MKVASGISVSAAYSIIIGSSASITSAAAAAFPPLKGQHLHDERDLAALELEGGERQLAALLAQGGRDLKKKKSNKGGEKKKSTLTWRSGNTSPVDGRDIVNTYLLAQGDSKKDSMNVTCGAIQAVLSHPTDANICYAGAVNGGVWRTNKCKDPVPEWLPLSDYEPSLSVGGMAFDALNSKSIIVAIGTNSARRNKFGGSIGGRPVGLILTDNAHEDHPTWTVLNNDGYFVQEKVKFISTYLNGPLVLALAYESASEDDDKKFSCNSVGLWRSTDRGKTWKLVLKGVGRALAADPNDPKRFYATLDHTQTCDSSLPKEDGVVTFTSIDDGKTWTATKSQSKPEDPLKEGDLINAKLSVSADGSRVWSGLVKRYTTTKGKKDKLYSIFFSDDHGTGWNEMGQVKFPAAVALVGGVGEDPIKDCDECTEDFVNGVCDEDKKLCNYTAVGLNPEGQGFIHFSLVASPKDKHIIYGAGDAIPLALPYSYIGATKNSGYLVRGNSSITFDENTVPSPQWAHMTNNDTISTIPEGGTAHSTFPHGDSRVMVFTPDDNILEGDDGGLTLRTSPSDNKGDWYSVCGTLQALEVTNVAYEPILNTVLFANQDNGVMLGELGTPETFENVLPGDGGIVLIDYKSDPKFNFYYASGLTGNTDFSVFKIDKKDGKRGKLLSDLKLKCAALSFPVTAMNPAVQRNFAIGVGNEPSPDCVPGSAMFYMTHYFPYTNTSKTFPLFPDGYNSIAAMDYSSDGKYLYAAASKREINQWAVSRCTIDLGTGFPQECHIVGGETTSEVTVITRIAVDPKNSDHVVLITVEHDSYSKPQVFESTDGGENWTDITGPVLAKAYSGQAVTFLGKKDSSLSFLVAGTSDGIYVRNGNDWKLLGDKTPTVQITGMTYSSEDDTLVIATFGRGIWYLEDAYRGACELVNGDGEGKKKVLFQ